jgi:signal-transduction protein with cAMP-binding, CBS, and nucleotidyltransferase domain
MPARTEVFTKLVRDYMGAAPVVVAGDDRCDHMLDEIRRRASSSAIVVDAGGVPAGIVTEQDISRKLALRLPGDTPVSAIMSRPVWTVNAQDRLFQAIGQMRRRGLRHMPVVDEDSGRVVGILELQVALSLAAARMVEQIDRLTHADTLEGMEETKLAQVSVAENLFEDSTTAPDVQRFITGINNDLYRRITDLCVNDMAGSSWGKPPADFDVIVMGSGGRGENFLYPDQDNGFILEDYPDGAHDEIDAWFIELATRMTRGLNRVGFPYCHGNVMATNPLWRKTLPQWQRQMDYWIGKGAGMVLRLADIFFDFKHVYGRGVMTQALRDHVTETAARPFFLREMFKLDADHEVALGPFNRLLTDREPGPGKGKLNLKMTGTLPLVGAARVGALANKIPCTSTTRRIDALYDRNTLSEDERDYLQGAYTHITNLMLRQQIRDFNGGRKVGNHVAPEDITRRERDMLVDGFRAIKRFRTRVRDELTGELF